MIQFNLLPDVKLKYVKTNRLKHTISVVAVIVVGVSLAVLVLLFLSVEVVQKARIHNLNNQMNSLTSNLQKTPNLNGVLTVQGAVNALPALNAQKPVTSRLEGYIAQITPASATISNLVINFQADTIMISGDANNLATVNLFVDILKDSQYQTSSKSANTNAFSDVVLNSFSYTTAITTGSSNANASYTINASFDPSLFSQADPNVTLNVTNNSQSRTSSGSSSLFQSQPSSNSSSNSTGQGQ